MESQNGQQNTTTQVSVAEMTTEFISPHLLLKNASRLQNIFWVLRNCTEDGFLGLTGYCSGKWSLQWVTSEWSRCPSVWLILTNSIPSLFSRNELYYIMFSIGKPKLDNIPSCCFGYYNSSCRKYWISLITDDDGGHKCAQNIITNNYGGNIYPSVQSMMLTV